jgi:hypothetical protein
VIGNPLKVADVLESWFRSGAADGFNVMPPFFSGQFDDFVERVVPILQSEACFAPTMPGRRCASLSAWNVRPGDQQPQALDSVAESTRARVAQTRTANRPLPPLHAVVRLLI